MNVRQLREMLEQYPDDMEVIMDFYSDYAIFERCDVIKGVPKQGYIMRSHMTMSEENKSKEKEYLLL